MFAYQSLSEETKGVDAAVYRNLAVSEFSGYFCSASPDLIACSRPCRPVYVAAVRSQSKHIVVLVDHGASVTDTQLQIARDSALVILNAVDEHDKVRGEATKIIPRPL